MSLYLTLGTGNDTNEVKRIATEIGFTKDYNGLLYHEKIDEFRLQIHEPAFTKFLDWINTEIEFDYEAEKLALDPRVFSALALLYENMPDMYYVTDVGEMFDNNEHTDFTHLFKPVSHAIEQMRREYI